MKYLLLLLLFSCSSMTQTYIEQGEFELKGGQSGEKNWESSIDLNHVSWFQELTLIFDVFYLETEKLKDFNTWFSDFEQGLINSCKTSYVALVYDLIDKRYSRKEFYQHLREQGFEVLEIPRFSSHLVLHPDFEEMSFNLYEAKLLCHKKTAKNNAKVILPSFQPVKFKL